jgi:proteasome accessory factor C
MTVRPAEQRLRRLLVMLPWLMERGEVPVSEVAERFDLSEQDVVGDLELAAMCGLPPFVDELIDVFIDEGMIVVGVPRLFTRPLRLNSVEAFELLAAARVAMELPGADPDGALARGLAKLARALGEDDTAGVKIELDKPELVDRLATAATAHEQLRIDYVGADRDETTSRRIVPRQVFTDRGEWYVSADDDRSGEVRTFRVDRITALDPTGEVVAPSDAPLPAPGAWFDDESVRRAVLRLSPAAHWVVERFPVDTDEGPDDGTASGGWSRVTLPVASEQWLVRTMLRLGPEAELVEPADLRDVVAAAAGRVLARYRRS